MKRESWMPTRAVKTVEHLFKKTLHLPFFLFLKKGDGSRVPVDPESVKSILILRPDKLGDMIVTVPAIHALKEKFPHIRLEVIASPRNKTIIESDPAVDEVHLYSKNILDDWPLVRRLRNRAFDVIYDPICHDSATGLLLTKLIRNGSVCVASRKLELQRYYDYCEPYQPGGADHNIDNGLLIFKVFGVDPDTINPFMPVYIPDKSHEKAKRFFHTMPDGGRFCVGVNISAGSVTRSLSPKKYAAIIKAINEKHPEFRFIIFCVMEQRREAERLRGSVRADIRLIPDNLTLLDVSAMMSRLNILISPDTSMVHIARLMKIPVVGLYSGHIRNFRFWKPYRQEYGSVVAKNVEDLHDIEPEQVAREFEKLLSSVSHPDIAGTRTG